MNLVFIWRLEDILLVVFLSLLFTVALIQWIRCKLSVWIDNKKLNKLRRKNEHKTNN